jgi:protein phosphatase
MITPRHFAISDVGKRHHNEDAYCIDPECGLYVVADGMGGHSSGEVASNLAVETIRNFFRDHVGDEAITWPWGMDSGMSLTENKVCVAVRMANRAVLSTAVDEHRGMGTTIVVMAKIEDRVVIGHIGDSRAYLLRDGKLIQLTRDHSLCNMMRDEGHEVTDEAMAKYSNIITRALGMNAENDRPELTGIAPKLGDVFLLCTDGLHDSVSEEEMIALLEREDGEYACQMLVKKAIEGGSSDNITAVIVRL